MNNEWCEVKYSKVKVIYIERTITCYTRIDTVLPAIKHTRTLHLPILPSRRASAPAVTALMHGGMPGCADECGCNRYTAFL